MKKKVPESPWYKNSRIGNFVIPNMALKKEQKNSPF